jgi:hypothetical protein
MVKADASTAPLGQHFLRGDCAETQRENRMAFMMPTKLCFRSLLRVFCEREESKSLYPSTGHNQPFTGSDAATFAL